MPFQRLTASVYAVLLPVSAVALIGCAGSSDPSDEGAVADDAAFGIRQGVDYSWARPSPEGLNAAGYTFAARYLSHTPSKDITRGEADALMAAGVDVVANWESSGTSALGGYAQGVADAQSAASEAAAAGMPDGRPIYFSVDFDAQPSQEGTIEAYYDGVASVLGRDRTGAYGGYYLIKRLFDAGKITWGWQAYAWSYGNWDERAQVRQWKNSQNVAGGTVDLDSAMVEDFGQWGHASAPVGPPTAAPASPSGCGTISGGQGLVAGQGFNSCDGRFQLAMQADGNLVVYRNGGSALWSTGTNGRAGFAAVMQGDGNFVLYGPNSNALWNSQTNGNGGARLVMQDDGNLVVYATDDRALWSSGTRVPGAPAAPSGCGIVHPGEGLGSGASFNSCSGAYTLAMQADGNLVLYHNGVGALWSTGTSGTTGFNAVMQGDGNFVLYDLQDKPLWHSHTNGDAGAFLAIQDDGNLVVYTSGSDAVWDSGTNGQ